MSIECAECERDLRGGHDISCSRHPIMTLLTQIRDDVEKLKGDRTAAQEANVQGGMAQLAADELYAPHPTPAPASGKVTDAMVDAAWRTVGHGAVSFAISRDGMRAALEAATSARQGEGVDTKPALPGQGSEFDHWYDEHGEGETTRDVARLAWNAGIRHARQCAPNAADAEVYRAVTLEDAEKVRRYFGASLGVHWITAQKRMLDALQSIGAVIPTAAPVPAEPIDPRDKKTMGLYEKFRVTRTDGSSGPGCKHEHCEYFVLDLTHDPHAYAALYSYADSCRDDFPMLADDLMDRTKDMPKPKPWPADEVEKK